MIKAQNKKTGYSLVEMVIYIAILTLVSVLVLNSIGSFAGSYRDLAALRNIDHSGIDAMERITRDIRAAESVDTSNSTLGSHPGVLTLIGNGDSPTTITRFYLVNGVVNVDLDGINLGPLTRGNSIVTNLVFRKLDSISSSAVKIDMTISSTVGGVTKVKTYHSTVILKGQ